MGPPSNEPDPRVVALTRLVIDEAAALAEHADRYQLRKLRAIARIARACAGTALPTDET